MAVIHAEAVYKVSPKENFLEDLNKAREGRHDITAVPSELLRAYKCVGPFQ